MKARASCPKAIWRTFKPAFVVCGVLVLTLFGSINVPVARGQGATGILPGTVTGGSGSGTPVPVGNSNGGGSLPDPSKGCVKGDGYWKTHPEAWPVTTLTVGGITYNQTQLLAILNTSSSDKSYLVAQHLISSMLNVANGLTDPAIETAIVDANAWLVTHPLGSKPNSDSGFSSTLTSFNTGGNGQTACDDSGVPITFTYFCQVENGQGVGKCPDGYYSTRYVWDGKKWKVDNSSKQCLTQAQCQPPVSDNLHSSLPCDPMLGAGGLTMVCAPRYGVRTANIGASVQTMCPINEVLRAPYPRALVNTDTNFFLQPALYDNVNGFATTPQSPDNLLTFVDANGDPTAAGYDAAVWRNFVLTMRSRRFTGGENWFNQTASLPLWNFWDRAWNSGIDPKVQQGATAKYVYATSSAGLASTLGRAYDLISRQPANSYSLPAYPVDIQTSCGHEWTGYAELSQRTWTKTGSCTAGIPLPDPPGGWWHEDGTSGEGCPLGQFAPGHYTYFWAPYSTSWSGLDMRLAGRPTSYDLQDTNRGGGQVNGSYYWDNNGANWVPVVEVQSVLRQSCVADGTCAPPVAEPSSLAP